MKIGFDAKRLFFNGSGLGNYSRSTVAMLSRLKPEAELVLFSPRPGNPQGFDIPDNTSVCYPSGRLMKKLRSLWRTSYMGRDIRRLKIDLYHGLSHELPADIRRSGARSVVTIHDLIFVRYPELYKPVDRWLYVRKYRRSCRLADRIIAISEQTKADLVEFWQIDPDKIDVVYQGCDPIFYEQASDLRKDEVRRKYDLPASPFILSVGTIEPRKNLLLTVKAMADGKIDVPLVACGRRTPYQDEILAYAESKGISHLIHFRNAVEFPDLPAIYRMAGAMVYASLFEGFGIPILEGLNSGVPVITTRGGVFPETGGDACLYVDPHSVEEMVQALRRTLSDSALREEMISKGYAYALNFREEALFPVLWSCYERTLG